MPGTGVVPADWVAPAVGLPAPVVGLPVAPLVGLLVAGPPVEQPAAARTTVAPIARILFIPCSSSECPRLSPRRREGCAAGPMRAGRWCHREPQPPVRSRP